MPIQTDKEIKANRPDIVVKDKMERACLLIDMSTGIVPDEWKQARVVPLHKSGGQEVMDNYRPIATLPVISKIAEKAVNVQLQQYSHHHGLLNAFQSGLRRHHSTLTAVTYFCDSIRRSMDAGKLTGALFIDLKKAFDTVPHDDVICKLRRFGLEKNSLVWMASYLITDLRLFVSEINYPVQCPSSVAYRKAASLARYCSPFILTTYHPLSSSPTS